MLCMTNNGTKYVWRCVCDTNLLFVQRKAPRRYFTFSFTADLAWRCALASAAAVFSHFVRQLPPKFGLPRRLANTIFRSVAAVLLRPYCCGNSPRRCCGIPPAVTAVKFTKASNAVLNPKATSTTSSLADLSTVAFMTPSGHGLP